MALCSVEEKAKLPPTPHHSASLPPQPRQLRPGVSLGTRIGTGEGEGRWEPRCSQELPFGSSGRGSPWNVPGPTHLCRALAGN